MRIRLSAKPVLSPEETTRYQDDFKALTTAQKNHVAASTLDPLYQLFLVHCADALWQQDFLAVNPALSLHVQTIMVTRAATGIARNPSLLPRLQRRLARQSTHQQDLARNPSLTSALQKHFARRAAGARLHNALAQNPSVSANLQHVLWQRKDDTTMRHLTKNPALCPDLQELILASQDLYLLAGLAENPALPAALQEHLSKDQDYGVRCGLAKNPALLLHLQEYLTQDGDSSVRRSLSRNHALLPACQVQLSYDTVCQSDLFENPALHLTSAFSVDFCLEYAPGFFADQLQQESLDDQWLPLAENFSSSVADFLQMTTLLRDTDTR